MLSLLSGLSAKQSNARPAIGLSIVQPEHERPRSGIAAGLLSSFAAGRLRRNGLFAVGQNLVVMVCAFLAYRLVIAHAGLEELGVLSLLLAGSALARLGDVSGAGALARFVAVGARHADTARARDTVHTVLLTSLGLNAALGLILWSAAPFLLPLFLAPTYLSTAYAFVPYVVGSMVLGALAMAVVSGIDGAQRADQRAVIVTVAALFFLGASWLLVPRYGVEGFAAAQVLQQITVLALGWILLRRHLAGLGWLPHRWRREVFVATTGYALKLNAIGVLGLLFEPLAELAFNHAGGPGLVALYELASRLIMQIRGLVIAAATPLIPAFAAQSATADPAFRHILERATRAAALAAPAVAAATLVAAPVMSLVVLGRISHELLSMNAALTFGWSLQLPCLALYLAAQGHGVLRWNFVSHALVAASVLVGAFVLIPAFGANGLVAAIVAGLVLSIAPILVGNASAFGATDIVWRLRWWLLGAWAAVAMTCLAAQVVATAIWAL